MKDNQFTKVFISYVWLLNMCVAWIQGGFWGITLNVALPIAMPIVIAEKIVNL